MTNLPKAFREQLKEAFAFDTPTELTKQVSKDGSRKYLLEYHDGVSVETSFPSAFPPRQAVAWAVPFALPVSTASSAL